MIKRLLLCLLCLCIGGCSGAADQRSNGKLKVVCTTGQVADLVQSIGGDQVEVTTLIGPGVDPHTFKQSLADLEALEAADVIFYNGLHLEGKLSELLEKLSTKRPTVSLGDELVKQASQTIRRTGDGHGQADPHVWFNAELWSKSIPAVVAKLSELRPAAREQFAKAGLQYQLELNQLHQETKTLLQQIPAESRVLITAHDAFGYFGDAYGIEVHGLQGISTVDEASLAGINQLIELLVTRKIKAVFVESSVPPERLQQVINGCDARGHKVQVGGELYSDAMGVAGSEAASYIGMFRYNVRTIVNALK